MIVNMSEVGRVGCFANGTIGVENDGIVDTIGLVGTEAIEAGEAVAAVKERKRRAASVAHVLRMWDGNDAASLHMLRMNAARRICWVGGWFVESKSWRRFAKTPPPVVRPPLNHPRPHRRPLLGLPSRL